MSELLPCPFCGGEAEMKKGTNSRFAIVECNTKDCQCTSFGGNCYDNEQEAIEAWNTRAERTCTIRKHDENNGECSNCGFVMGIYDGYDPYKEAYTGNNCINCGAKVVSE